jgi:methyl-accepting chemotaxis protein
MAEIQSGTPITPTVISGESRFELLFLPATRLMNRFRYAYKFLLIGTVIVLPLLFLLQLQYSAAAESRDFSERERLGILYIDPSKDVLAGIAKRRVLVAAIASGDQTYTAQLAAVTDDIERAVQGVDAVDAKSGEDLKVRETWQRAKAAWLKAKTVSGSPEEVDAAHSEASALMIQVINAVGDSSNLILDPDLDSYWLMDAYVIKLPALADAVGRSLPLALKPGKPGDDRSFDLAAGLGALKSTSSDLVNVNLATAIKETKLEKNGQSLTLQPNLEGPGNAARDRAHSFEATARQSSDANGASKALVDAAVSSIDEAQSLHRKISPELDWLITKRASKYARRGLIGVALGAVAVVALVYLFVGLYFAVRRPVSVLAASSAQMIAGRSDALAIDTRDEVQEIVGAFNQINAALVEARELRQRVDTEKQRVERENSQLQENIMDLLRVVSDASDGDLRVRAKITEGALGNVADAFNQLLESLEEVIGGITGQLDRTLGAVQAITSSSEGMANDATKQVQEIVSATRLVQKMSEELQRVLDTAQVAASAAKRTESTAAEGATGVDEAIQGMTSLRGNVQAGAKKMKGLGDRSMEITGIVGTIARISEQTNMLALNAAIEAARAGEHGRGFTVVAEEVRKLAERTALATQEIDRLVKTIHSETMDTVAAIEQQTSFVEREAVIVGRTGDSLARIREVSSESAARAADITGIAVAQVKESTFVVVTMGEISGIAENTQKAAQGTVKTVEELRGLSVNLVQSIQKFKLTNGSARA